MSWTADIIYTIPNIELSNELKLNNDLNTEYGIYLIDNLRGIESEWTKELMKNEKSKNKHHRHELPENGLLAIKPLEYKSGYNNDYSKYNYWENRAFKIDPTSEIDHVIKTLKDNIKIEIQDNQMKVISFANDLQKKYNQPIVYYRCDTWGGSTEFEFAIAIDSTTRLFLFESDENRCNIYEGGSKTFSAKSVLQETMKLLNQELNTSFFALHQRSFNWSIYRV